MKRKIELLAPGGDIDCIKAAIAAGADAVYCGLNTFNARNRATNIDFKDLNGILNLAHKNNCKVFLTLNIIIVEKEIPALFNLLNKLVNTSIDGVIVQDLGLLYLLSKHFKGLKIHASTQLNTHNEGQIGYLNELTASQINLSRELNIDEIKALAVTGARNHILTEIFVHGSYCISFSGICYISSVLGGKSGNRGRCSQPCRDRYLTTHEGRNFPLNLKDNSAYFDLKEIADAGVGSIKIEGRIKKYHYVYTAVNCWKKQLLSFYSNDSLSSDNSDLYRVFNRDFSNAYLKGDINKSMFIDNPRDNSAILLAERRGSSSEESINNAKKELHDIKTEIIIDVKDKIKHLEITKTPITIVISGKPGSPLKISVRTPDTSFTVFSETSLIYAGTGPSHRYSPEQRDEQTSASTVRCSPQQENKNGSRCLNYNALFKRFKTINNTEYYIEHLDLENLQADLFIPFKELTLIKKRIAYIFNGSKEIIDPIDIPALAKQPALSTKPLLGVLISSKNDLHLCNETSADIYFQLPDCLKDKCSEFIDLFSKNRRLIPWFPCVLIGEDYNAAVKFLLQVKPELIVTNNTGIAYEAYREKIAWIAGPYLNMVNSFSLLCLKESFNCYGSFISNEISRTQIRDIKKPENFRLYYSIYHPILLMTSRQCLLHQVIGCDKDRIDEECIAGCNRSASITNSKRVSLFIKKTEGNYHSIYNNHNFLNTDIVTDLPGIFSGFFIDLRDIKTETKIEQNKSGIVKLFENLLNGDPDSETKLKQIIHPATSTQYREGI